MPGLQHAIEHETRLNPYVPELQALGRNGALHKREVKVNDARNDVKR